MTDEISRREFVKTTVAGTAILAGASVGAMEAAIAAPIDPNKQVVSALGAVFIPSKPGDPGYKELEAHGITDYVMQKLPVADSLETFNSAAKGFFDGKAFLDLDEKQREQYVGLVADGNKITDAEQRTKLQAVYRGARTRILRVFYSNFPAHEVKRNAAGEAVLRPGDTHQISNPNLLKDKKLVTGWDIAGFKGPLGWEEEEQLREKAKKTVDYWFENDLVRLNPSRPPAAAAIKTSDGHDYYDVIVLGGGTAGCIVAGRLAERGINPKTGDRLKVAMIEGGDDWTIRDQGIKPGYGSPIRRKYITNINDGTGPDGNVPAPSYHWNTLDGGENFKVLGGCTLHYGGQLWIPQEEDFHFYREASGVNWDLAKFGDAIQEIRDIYHVQTPPDSWWRKATYMWTDAGRALGYEMYPASCALRNSFIGTIFDGYSMNRFDSKGTSLPWAYIGLNNGLKVIPNAEVQKIVIEKVPGGRPVATGAVYTDKAGTAHEVRAARVIVAMGTGFTPMLLHRSGYGSRELLGDKVIVENKNVGHHLTGDNDLVSSAYLAEPVSPAGREGNVFGEHGPWCATTPRPWGELTVHIRSGGAGRLPDDVAVGPFAPAYGWDHKEYMRNETGVTHIMSWRTHLGAIPWSWRVLPDTRIERVELDAPRVDAKIKEAGEIIRAWHSKLSVKPVKVDMRAFNRKATELEPGHRVGTARAGSSPANSVCTSDYDCHDIDNLLFTSAATIPRTFFWSAGPTAVNAAYAWRRMLANHFTTGSSTKGFA